MTFRWPSALAALISAVMPPPWAAEVTVDQFFPPLLEPPDELVPQPAARTTLLAATATAANFLDLLLSPTISPPNTGPNWVRTGASSRGKMTGRCPKYNDWPARMLTIGDCKPQQDR